MFFMLNYFFALVVFLSQALPLTAQISGRRGLMYDLQGTQDFLEVPAHANFNFGANNFSFEAWVRSVDDQTEWQCLWEFNNGTTMGFHFYLLGQNSSVSPRGLYINAVDVNLGEHRVITAPQVWRANEWNHLAFTRNGTQITFYVNGHAFAGIPVLTDAPITTGMAFLTHTNWQIGARRSGSARLPLRGFIDEVRIWNRSLNQNEIRERQHLTLEGTETGLVAYYQFNNDLTPNTAQGVRDALGNHHGRSFNVPPAGLRASEVPVAAGHSDRLQANHSGWLLGPSTGLQINFLSPPQGEIVLSRLRTEPPHGWEHLSLDSVQQEYFIIRNYGDNPNPIVENIIIRQMDWLSAAEVAVPSHYALFRRASRAWGNSWPNLPLAWAQNAWSGNNGGFEFRGNPLLTSFSQFVIARDFPVFLDLNLEHFQAQRAANQEAKVNLTWRFQTPSSVQQAWLERSKNPEQGFEPFYQIDLNKTETQTLDWQFDDQNTYYRLLWLDAQNQRKTSALQVISGLNIAIEKPKLFPNPCSNETVYLNGLKSDTWFYTWHSTTGQVLDQGCFELGLDGALVELKLKPIWAAGQYFLSLSSKSKPEEQLSFLVQKR